MRKLSITQGMRPLGRLGLAGIFLIQLFLSLNVFAQAEAGKDNLAEALIISDYIGSVTNSNVSATKEAGEPNHGGELGGASIWYEWVAPANGIVTFETIGSVDIDGNDLDTSMGAYKGDSYNNLVSVAQNDEFDRDFSGLSQIKFYATAGTVYRIAVDTHLGQAGGGDIVLSWYYFNAGLFHFTLPEYVVSEWDNFSPDTPSMSGDIGAKMTITRQKGFDGAVNVLCEVTYEDGTVEPYTVHFKDFQMSSTLTVPVPNDDTNIFPQVVFDAAIVGVEFDSAEGVATNRIVYPKIDDLFGLDVTQVRILNDEPRLDDKDEPVATVNFERSNLSCGESVGNASIWVYRVGPTKSCSVSYRINYGPSWDQFNGFQTRAGSDYATPFVDYTPVVGTLTWADKDPFPKLISVPIINKNKPEFNRDFLLELYNPSSCSLGDISDCVVTIRFDNQPAGAVDRTHLKDFALDTTPPNNATPGANKTVYAVAVQSDNKTIIGGDFTAFNTTSRNRIARLKTDGQLDTGFNPGSGADGFVTSLALDSAQRVLVGGAFSSINGTQRYGIARLSNSGALDTTFNPGLGADDLVWSVAALPSDKVVIAGSFTSVNATNRNYIARLKADGSVDEGFDPGVGPNGTVFTVVPQTDGKIIIGGEFTSVGGVPRNHIARLNDDGTLDLNFDPASGVDDTVYTVAIQTDGKILIGGSFTSVDLRSRSGIARLNADGTLDTSFDPGTGFDDTVYSIILQADGKPLVGGIFKLFNQTRRVGVARLFADGLLDTSFMDTAYNQYAGIPNANNNIDTNPKNYVFALGLQSDGDVMIAGGFSRVGGGNTRIDMRNRANVARLIGNSTMGPGNIGFAQPTYSGDENNGQLYLTLLRTNGNLGQIAALFNPSSKVSGPGAAVYGEDFTFTERFTGNRIAVPDVRTPTFVTSWRRSPAPTWRQSDGIFGFNNISDTVDGDKVAYGEDDLYINVLTDGTIEGDELANFDLTIPQGSDTFFLGGENIPLGAALGRPQAEFTVADKDVSSGTLGFSSGTYNVDENAGNATITVIRTNGTTGTITIQYATVSGGTATPAGDYTTRTGTLTFRPGETSKSFTIPIIDDSTVEPDETIKLQLSNATGGAKYGLTNAFLTIIDNDFKSGRVNFSSATYATNENGGNALITVTRTGGSLGQLSVNFATSNLTAIAGVNYTATTGTLTWNSGETSPKTILIPIINDNLVGTDRDLGIALFNPSVVGALGTTVTNAIVTILEDDSYGVVHFNRSEYNTKENGGRATVTVVRSGGSAEQIQVGYEVAVGNGSPSDFTPQTGTLTFAPGEVSKSFDVIIQDNEEQEGNRFISLQLLNANPASTLGLPSAATINIIDDETYNEPAGSVDTAYNTSVGANNYVYSLALQSDGKLIVGGDFTTMNGLTRNRIARLDSNGILDNRFSAPSLGANGSVRSLLSLTNNAGAPDRVMLAGAFTSVNNTNRNYIARLNLDGSLDGTFNPGSGANNPVYAMAVTYAGNARKYVIGGAFTTFNGVPRNNVAILNDDGSVDTSFNFTSGANGIVYTVAVQTDGKILIGGDFTTVNGTPRPRLARLNTDGTLDLTFDPGTGASDSVRAIVKQFDGRILVGGLFTNLNGTALNHIARLDKNGSVDLTFTPGLGANDSVYTIALQTDEKILLGGEFTKASGVTRNRLTRLNSDGTLDPNINFGSGANSFIAALAIQNDDKIIIGGGFTEFDGVQRNHLARLYGNSLASESRIEFTSANFSAAENGTNAVITLRRRGGTASSAFGDAAVILSTTNLTADAGVDYESIVTNVAFPSGETFRTVLVPLINDDLIESDEQVLLALSHPPIRTAELGNQPTATLTILSDDSGISFSDSNYRVQENAVNGVAIVNVARTGNISGSAIVDVRTTGIGTATASLDYSVLNSTVTFAAGETNKLISIPVINDTEIEGDETFQVQLANVSGAFLLEPTTTTVTVVDDDFAPGRLGFSTTNYTVIENQSFATITVTRTNGSTGSVSIKYATSNGSGIAGIDYTNTTGTLIFADGEMIKSFNVPLSPNDTTVELPKTVNITISNPTGGATIVGASTVVLTILDDDVGIGFSSPAFAVTEGNNINITVQRINGSNGPVSVNYTTAASNPASAQTGSDYVAASGTLTFAPGETVKTFTVSTVDDSAVEGDESFQVLLLSPSNGAQLMSPSNAVVTILDNDSGFFFANATYSVLENGTNAVITVIRTNGNTGIVSVNYSTSAGPTNPASAGSDYNIANGILTFLDGETVKTFNIPISDDSLVEGNETVTVTISNPSTGTKLLSPSTAVLTIVDNDAGISLSSPTYSVNEGGVNATITVIRTNYLSAQVTVDYSTINGTALSGIDYQSASGTLVFTNGQVSNTFLVPIIDDTLEEGDETVLLKLTNPTGNAVLLNPSAATLSITDNDGSVVIPAGSQLISESFSPSNNVIETNETVTILFALRNTGTNNTTNLVATLVATNGVTSPSTAQNYGVLVSNGASVSRPFTFTASGTNGGRITAAFLLQDGNLNVGRVTFTYTLGTSAITFSNTNRIEVLDNTMANPYPSIITISGVSGSIRKISASVTNLSHPYPDDIDMLLVSPNGQKSMLLSDAGGSFAVTNVTLTFDKDATNIFPDAGLFSSGIYQPADYVVNSFEFPSPAPAGPYQANMSPFEGGNPNGDWKLYVVDDTATDSGSIAGGWSLQILTSSPLAPFTDLSVTMSDNADPIIVSNNVTYNIAVTNHGPSSATGVFVTNTIPAGATLISANTSQGSFSTNAGQVIFNVGSLAKDANALLAVTVRVGTFGALNSSTVAVSNETDPNPANNVAVETTTVNAATADLSVSLVGTPNPAPVLGTLTYIVRVTNAGPATASDVTLTNTLPADVSNVSVVLSQGSYLNNAGVLVCSFGSVSNGAVATATISLTPTAQGTLTNVASVGSSVPDPLKGNNSASIKTVVEAPRFSTVVQGGNLKVSWPLAATGYRLEYTTDLTPPVVWVADSQEPVIEGDQNTISIGNSAIGTKFYRLVK